LKYNNALAYQSAALNYKRFIVQAQISVDQNKQECLYLTSFSSKSNIWEQSYCKCFFFVTNIRGK